MRISGEECVPGSIRFEDTLAFIQMAEPYIDGVQISAGLDINHEGNVHMATTNFKEHMPNLKWARTVKKTCPGLVVSVVGAIMNPTEAEPNIGERRCRSCCLRPGFYSGFQLAEQGPGRADMRYRTVFKMSAMLSHRD